MKRKIVLVISVVCGILAALMTHFYIVAKDAEVQKLKDSINRRYGTMEALCFSRDVPAGMTVSKADLGLKTVPALGLRGQALTRDNVIDVVGRKTTIAHRAGDVVFWADIQGGNPSAVGLSADIKRQMRAVSINCAGAASVSGMVKPNDHVDVIGTFSLGKNPTDRDAPIVTCTILQNVLVLATGTQMAKDAFKNLGVVQGYSTVTLEVTPREAEMLAFAEQIKGRLVLSLRNRNDTSFEKELPKVDFEMIRKELETLNVERQQKRLSTQR